MLIPKLTGVHGIFEWETIVGNDIWVKPAIFVAIKFNSRCQFVDVTMTIDHVTIWKPPRRWFLMNAAILDRQGATRTKLAAFVARFRERCSVCRIDVGITDFLKPALAQFWNGGQQIFGEGKQWRCEYSVRKPSVSHRTQEQKQPTP